MAAEAHGGHADLRWFVPPGEGDYLVAVVLVIVLVGLYGIVYLYAVFDRWAEHQSQGTPLAKTIPTLLAIALIYEIFPLDHFHPLLPLSAILIALMADWSRFHLNDRPVEEPAGPTSAAPYESEAKDV